MNARSLGFTLIELLVTLAVAAILLAVAAPVLLNAIGSRSAQSVGSIFSQNAAWVRSEAIAGALPASITIESDCSYSASVNGESASDLAAHSMTSAQVAQTSPGLSCTGVPAGGLTLNFDALGLVTIPTGQTSNTPTTIGFSSSQGGAWSSTVEIFGSGIFLWNPQDAN